ncbi:transglutaminase-like domain-containing protein [Alphaproteobacteria bacterium]|nr:transglutaminase-like domain-containing protein [Alphaproteobacteria bacterium]
MITNRRSNLMRSLTAQGRLKDADMDLAECALLLAGLDRPDSELSPFRNHLAKIVRDVRTVVPSDGARHVAGQAQVLASTLSDKYNYEGDTLTYDDPQNANLIRVIQRRKGLPITLAILYIHVAREQGWAATGINFPGHFLIRLEEGGGQLILDPFNGGVTRDIADLRGLLKQMTGIEAELQPEHCAPIGNRQMLMRLLNNIKFRATAAKDPQRVAEILDRMLMVAPDHLELLSEAGQCHAEIGNMRRAIAALEKVVTHSLNDSLRRESEALLRQVRARLN